MRVHVWTPAILEEILAVENFAVGALNQRTASWGRRRDGGRDAQDTTATAIINNGYAIVRTSMNPEAHSDATAPVKSKNTPA